MKAGFLKNITRFLVSLSFGLICFISMNVFFGDISQSESILPDVGFKNSGVVEKSKDAAEIRPFSGYAVIFEKKDLFKTPYLEPSKRKSEKVKPDASMVSGDFEKKFKLVGIVLDGDPQAIVEDIGKKKTLFLSPGDKIGDIVLEKIYEDKVIFSDGDKQLELKP